MQEMQEMWVWSLGRADPLEHVIALYSGILAWKICWAEEPGRLSPRGREETDRDEARTHTYTHSHPSVIHECIEILKVTSSEPLSLGIWECFFLKGPEYDTVKVHHTFFSLGRLGGAHLLSPCDRASLRVQFWQGVVGGNDACHCLSQPLVSGKRVLRTLLSCCCDCGSVCWREGTRDYSSLEY